MNRAFSARHGLLDRAPGLWPWAGMKDAFGVAITSSQGSLIASREDVGNDEAYMGLLYPRCAGASRLQAAPQARSPDRVFFEPI